MAIRDGDEHHLHRRQPRWEGTREVLGDDPDEPLEAAIDGVVDDDRPRRPAIGRAVLHLEALRQLVVDLDRGHLPLAAQRVVDEDVDLRRVEGPATRVDRVRDAGALGRLRQLPLGHVPELLRPQLLGWARGELEARLEAERLVLAAHQTQGELHLVDDLVLAADDVRVVLGQLPHSEDARQGSGRLVAEEPAVVGKAHRQVAV